MIPSCIHVSYTNANIVFWAGLGDGLLCDGGVLWNFCALGQVNTLIWAVSFSMLDLNGCKHFFFHSFPTQSVLRFPLLYFIALCLGLWEAINRLCVGGSFASSAYKPDITDRHTHSTGQTYLCVFCVKKCNMSHTFISHPHVVCSALSTWFHHTHTHTHTTTRSTHSSVFCNMPDGRDQEIRHWGEHMCLAHYPSLSPSSTLHTRLHMLRTGSHFSTTMVIVLVRLSCSSSILAFSLFLNFMHFWLIQFNASSLYI